ncbi:MAG: MOSC domain-containing protein [Candidatus Phaeomarinobacter sp.]
MSGRVLAIARCLVKRGPMQLLPETAISLDKGVEGDPRGHKKGRQVTVMSREAWEAACAELGKELDWTTRRANVLVEGVDLAFTKHQKLRIGEVHFTIAMQTQPCFLMDEFESGLKDALKPDWRGGACCTVDKPGIIRVGDDVAVLA